MINRNGSAMTGQTDQNTEAAHRNNPRIDPEMESLLDEALSPQSVPGEVPRDLTDRIVAATLDDLAAPRRGVVARIGPSLIRTVAAAVIIASSVAIILMLNGIVRNVDRMETITASLAELQKYEHHPDNLDTQILQLAAQINEFDGQELWSADASSPVQELLDFEWQLDHPGSTGTSQF